jgi:hypothetical protein
MRYADAITALNDAANAALRASGDTAEFPSIDRQALRLIARETGRLVDQGEQSGEHPSHIMSAA